LLGASQGSYPQVAIVAIDDAGEGAPGQKVHQLGEQRFAGVHGGAPREFAPKLPHGDQIDTTRFSPKTYAG